VQGKEDQEKLATCPEILNVISILNSTSIAISARSARSTEEAPRTHSHRTVLLPTLMRLMSSMKERIMY
jgi:hypothetical protein